MLKRVKVRSPDIPAAFRYRFVDGLRAQAYVRGSCVVYGSPQVIHHGKASARRIGG